jgi:hypothetical protein
MHLPFPFLVRSRCERGLCDLNDFLSSFGQRFIECLRLKRFEQSRTIGHHFMPSANAQHLLAYPKHELCFFDITAFVAKEFDRGGQDLNVSEHRRGPGFDDGEENFKTLAIMFRKLSDHNCGMRCSNLAVKTADRFAHSFLDAPIMVGQARNNGLYK